MVVADTIQPEEKLRNFRTEHDCPIVILAIASPKTPESGRIQRAARLLGASWQTTSPDDTDIHALVRLTARAPLAVADAGEGVRWAEMGWWLVPPLAALVLLRFRRVRHTKGNDS